MSESQATLERTVEKTPGQQPSAARRQSVKIDESKLTATYANFCRVTGTPEELILDFGLNAQPLGTSEDAIAVTQRIVTNFFTAKRMLHALSMAVSRHEKAFGALEIDIQKRVQPQPTQN